MREGYEKSRKKIKKTLDKLPRVCYNKDIKGKGDEHYEKVRLNKRHWAEGATT